MDRPGVCQVSEGSGEWGEMEETDCEIICGAPTTFAVKELMMIMIMKSTCSFFLCFFFLLGGGMVDQVPIQGMDKSTLSNIRSSYPGYGKVDLFYWQIE